MVLPFWEIAAFGLTIKMNVVIRIAVLSVERGTRNGRREMPTLFYCLIFYWLYNRTLGGRILLP